MGFVLGRPWPLGGRNGRRGRNNHPTRAHMRSVRGRQAIPGTFARLPVTRGARHPPGTERVLLCQL